MAISILVLGESGTGKSTSLRNLKPAETFIIEVIDKPLPFRNRYKKLVKKPRLLGDSKDETESEGNLFISDSYESIIKVIRHVNDKRPEIKNIVIDDFQYIMANEFMRRATEKGYEKFTQLAQQVTEILNAIRTCREDLAFFVLTHSEMGDNGKYKAKTIGKLLDEKITLEGLFTIVLHSQVTEDRYRFLTQNDGIHIAKSPMDMFSERYIDNDLQFVKTQIDNYYNADIPQ